MTLTSHSFTKQLALLTAFVVLFFAIPFLFAHAADLSLTPSTGSYGVGQTFTVTVKAVPNGDSVNAVEAALQSSPCF